MSDGLIGSVNVTEVGSVGDCSAGKDSFRERGGIPGTGNPDLSVVVRKAEGRASRDVSMRFKAEGRGCGEIGNGLEAALLDSADRDRVDSGSDG